MVFITNYFYISRQSLNLIHLKNQKKKNDERSLAKTFHILPKMNAINSTYLQQQKKLFFLANFLDSERRWLLLLLIQTFIIKTFPLMKRGRGKRHTKTNIRYKMKKITLLIIKGVTAASGKPHFCQLDWPKMVSF